VGWIVPFFNPSFYTGGGWCAGVSADGRPMATHQSLQMAGTCHPPLFLYTQHLVSKQHLSLQYVSTHKKENGPGRNCCVFRLVGKPPKWRQIFHQLKWFP
jgi:hypothetical protein